MEKTNSSAPRRISDGIRATCAKCNALIYAEDIVGVLQADGTYEYTRQVRGGFVQKCDPEGTPTGPVIPKCDCEE